MSDYSRTIDFDALDTAVAIIDGHDQQSEFDDINTASATKANKIVISTADRIISMDAAGDMQDSGLNVPKTPQVDAAVIIEKGFTTPLHNAGTGPTLIDWKNGNIQRMALTTNKSVAFSSPGVGWGADLTLRIHILGTGVITWSSAIKWPGGTAPVASAVGKLDVYRFWHDGNNYYGRTVKNFNF